MSSRNHHLDLLKGLTIFLVILGHCIQFCSGLEYFKSSLYYDNCIFKLIYSFHMPLFSLISGYFFYSTANKYNLLTIMKRRFLQLLLPVFIIYFIYYTLIAFMHHGEFSSKDYLSWYFSSCYSSFWFLWATFLISILLSFTHHYLKDNIFIYLFFLIITLITPDSGSSIMLYKFVYPYFLIGYYFKKNNYSNSFIWKKCNSIYGSLTILLIFSGLFLLYSNDSYIYTTGIFILRNFPIQIFIDIYRFLVGLLGSLLFIVYIKKIPIKLINAKPLQLISYSGQYTGFIYIFQYFFIQYFLLVRFQSTSHSIITNLFQSFIILLSALFTIYILNHWSISAFLLLGKVHSIFPSRTS